MTEAEALEIYPDEVKKVAAQLEALQRRFEFATFGTDTTMMDQFNAAARDLLGQVGFEVDVHWDEYVLDGKPSGVYQPEVVICGRTRKEAEVDHDRMRYGVQRGLDGSQPGVIREDGSRHAEPRKKIIT